MLRKLAPLALCISSLVCATDKATIITSKYLMASSQGYLVTHDKKGFKVDGKPVHKYDLDASLRNLSRSRINDLLKKDHAKLEVTRVGHDYSIKCREQLRGGGAGGAWLGSWLGYGSVMAGSKLLTGAIAYPIGLINPFAGLAVAAVLETVVPVVVQPVALTAGIAGGIALGTATGPI